MTKLQRIRDPLHDLIQFSGSELEGHLWSIIQTRPFQRLRRIKQLGFSDFVYPGATHSRFSHSIGVFHTARRLMEVVRLHGSRKETKENEALAAALLHDLGHGPFSHAFEAVGKKLNLKLADHEHMSDQIIRDSEVSVILKKMGGGFADDVANIIKKDGVKIVQHAVVSSQFDADRLDYMRRDRLMTGTQHAAIDFQWLMENLEIGAVPIGVDEAPYGTTETFVLGPKAIYAAESFVLGLFQLYPTVYLHKATRGAEKLFAKLIIEVVQLVRKDLLAKTGLPSNHPLIKFAREPDNIDVALSLDDTVIWGALALMADAEDKLVSDFASRLRDRKLHKCIDVRERITHHFDPKGRNDPEVLTKIDECCKRVHEQIEGNPAILIDETERSPYKDVKGSTGPLNRINIRTQGGSLVDLKERSSTVAALKTFKLLRAYYPPEDSGAVERIETSIKGELHK